MVWFKVDDSFWSHPKVLPLSGEALALWVRAGAYCAQQLTDGIVSLQALRMLADRDAAVELTNAGLWEVEPTGGFRFHDWAEYQPTREHVISERAKATERKRKSREASQRASRTSSRRDTRGTDAVIGGPARTTAPVPDTATIDPFCPKHMPSGPGGRSCRACADAKLALLAAQAAAKAKPTPTPSRDPECEIHPGYPLPCDRCARDAEEAR
jgi:hypothetical protein